MFWPRGNGEAYRRSKVIGSVKREISWHDIPGEPVAKRYHTRRFTRDYRTWETYDSRMMNSCRLVVSFNKAKITVSCREVSGSSLRPAATFVYPDIPRIRFRPRNAADARVRYYHDTADYHARLCSGQRNLPVFNLFGSDRIAFLFFLLKWCNRKCPFYQPGCSSGLLDQIDRYCWDSDVYTSRY